MDVRRWYKRRGIGFIVQRGKMLLKRYSIKPVSAVHRIETCIALLAEQNCAPTLFVPAILVQRYPQFIRRLQEANVEIGVHGYDHISFADISITEARHQLLKASQTFQRFGIESQGFRCPYVGCCDDLLDALPGGVFDYSSNQMIFWSFDGRKFDEPRNLFFDTLSKLYKGNDSSNTICAPMIRSNLVEIPICAPDDLQLHDGLGFDNEQMTWVWDGILRKTHLRSELFNLIFHTELASSCAEPFVNLIHHARLYQPAVWIARIRDISAWWREKSTFKAKITPTSRGIQITFVCSSSATILARGLEINGSATSWDGKYVRLQSNMVHVPAIPRPFIGISLEIPKKTFSFLQEQGYILDAGKTSIQCGIYLDSMILAKLGDEVHLIDYLETCAGPLIKFGRWPNGAKSAMCISGDLDALTLLDYAKRVLI